MKIYVASGLEQLERVSELITTMKFAGYEVTYDWTKHGPLQDRSDMWASVGQAELSGVLRADVLIALLPGGRGTHFEMGAAVMSGKRVIVVGHDPAFQTRTCLFYHHPSVTRIPKVEDVWAELQKITDVSRIRRVILETPLNGIDAPAVEKNKEYARRAMEDSLRRGEAPMVSHLLYTQVLNDRISAERKMGIDAGLAWGCVAEATVVYTDRGISPGMQLGIKRAEDEGRAVFYRSIGETP